MSTVRPNSAATDRFELRPGYTVNRLINGGWQLSEGHRPGSAAVSDLNHLRALVDAGFTTFDCADIYTGVEQLLGRLVAEHRASGGDPDALQIHTKCVPDLDALHNLARQDVERTVHRSLRRLGVERLDLVQFHWWDWATPGWLEALDWLNDLRRDGKIRHLAVTNFDTPRLEEALRAGYDIVAHQLQYSVLDRRPERTMTDLCRRHNVHFLAYGSLAGGFLSQRWRGRDAPTEALENRSLVKYRLIIEEVGGWSLFQSLLDDLHRLGEIQQASIANLAVRWVLDRPNVAAAIVGARNAEHVKDNRRTLHLELTEIEKTALDSAVSNLGCPPGDVYSVEREVGGRHAVIMRTRLNRD